MELGKRKAELSHSPQRDKKSFVEDPCEPMSHSDCKDCTAVTTSQCEQQCTATGERCKRRVIDPGTVPYCMQHISILAVRPDRWPATELDALRRAFVYVRDHVIPTSRYTPASKRQRHIMFDKAVGKLTPTVSSRLFGGSEDIVTHITPFFTFPERIDRSPTITDRDSEIVLDKILQQYDAGAPTVRQLKDSHRWIDDRHRTEEQKYDASKTYFIHCHDIGHTEHIVQKFELQHVVLIGTFERWVRDGVEDKNDIFRKFNNLQSVKFLLPWVTHVGHCWMSNCATLKNPSFAGLSSLLEVGVSWMNYCHTLEEALSFVGLSSLETIGSSWMSMCNALKNPSFTGLSRLETVGHFWMTGCYALKNPSFTGLLRLEKIGSYWMARCKTLVDPKFDRLSSLNYVGPYGHRLVQEYFQTVFADPTFVEDPCEPMSHSDCQDCTAVTTSQCKQQCTATGERCKRRSIHPGTVPYCMQHISILAVRPDRWPATELDALRRAFVYVRDHVIPTSRYTPASKRQRHIMFDKAVGKLTPTVSSRLFGGSEDIVTHITPFFTFPERIDRSPTITDRDSEIVLDKILQHYDAGAPTVRHLQESHRWIDDRHFSEEQKYDASKTYFIHCHDIGHTERIVQKFELQHIVLIGTFKRWFRDGVRNSHRIFASFNNLRSVKFLLPWVTCIGNYWLSQCDALENPIFTGLSSLVEVETHWMDRCHALKNPSFIGLSSLRFAGSYWMSDCDTLENPSFIGLSSLMRIGSCWMEFCPALKSPSFTGLSSVTRVGPCGHKTVDQYFDITDTCCMQ